MAIAKKRWPGPSGLRGGCLQLEGEGPLDREPTHSVHPGDRNGTVADGDGVPVALDAPLPRAGKIAFNRDPAVLRKMVENFPKDAKAWAALGSSMMQGSKGDHDSALHAYRRALELEPGNVLALNNVGHIHASRAELPDAEAAYRKGLHCSPRHVPCLVNLGVLLYSQKDPPQWEEAEDCFERALKIEPAYFKGMVNYANFMLERPIDDADFGGDEPEERALASRIGAGKHWQDGEKAYLLDTALNEERETELLHYYLTCKVPSPNIKPSPLTPHPSTPNPHPSTPPPPTLNPILVLPGREAVQLLMPMPVRRWVTSAKPRGCISRR